MLISTMPKLSPVRRSHREAVQRRRRDARVMMGLVSPRRRTMILAVVAVAGVLLVAGGLRLLHRGDPSGRPDQARPGPVILVPGYGGSQTALRRLADRLAAAGRSTEVLTLPDGGTGDLLAQADT